jgi:hypothetical protein
VLVVFCVCGGALALSAVRTLAAPSARWREGSRWMMFLSQRRGERPPSDAELRFWASVWLLVGLAVWPLASRSSRQPERTAGRESRCTGRSRRLAFRPGSDPVSKSSQARGKRRTRIEKGGRARGSSPQKGGQTSTKVNSAPRGETARLRGISFEPGSTRVRPRPSVRPRSKGGSALRRATTTHNTTPPGLAVTTAVPLG